MPLISDSATWVAVGVAIGAGSLAFIGALIVLLASSGGGGAPTPQSRSS